VTLTIAQTATFAALWRHWRLTDEDLQALERQLMANPSVGPVMRDTGGVRKARFAPPSLHAGKSGAFRVCYLYFPRHATICFVLLFPKNQQPNLTPAQKKTCAALSTEIQAALQKPTRLRRS
jgi:hypothetical protein